MGKKKKKKTASGGKQSISDIAFLLAAEKIKSQILTEEGNRLEHIKTCDLVAELWHREGVEAHEAEPYKDLTVNVNGPAVVLVVID